MRKIIILLLFLFSITLVPTTFAQNNSFVSIVNPVRGTDFWQLEDQKPETAVLGQIAILEKFNLPSTWLLRFDALGNKNVIDPLKNRDLDEKGLFLEVTPTLTQEAGVEYQQSDSWHAAGSAFLTGYGRKQRLKLIDTAFEKFKITFGYYPVSVGAWWIDSFSLGYMQQKYGISSTLIVSDQYSTDNYQVWGQYFGTPYYPAKNNALHPAQTEENKLDVVIMQWAARDPVNGYGNGVLESTFSVQANDYIDYHNLDTKYFSALVNLYTKQQFNQFAHLVVGLENSYDWTKYSDEYKKQIDVLANKRNANQISIIPMRDFATWYKSTFPKLSPEHIVFADDPLGSFKKVVWFMNPYYRAGWFFNADGSVLRDIRQYIDGEEELCFKERCDTVNFATSATRVLDEVSFGNSWVIDQGKLSDFKINKEGEEFVISYTNEAGNLRKIGLLPRDISIDGEIFSIDSTILNATKKENAAVRSPAVFDSSLQWSLVSVILKISQFLAFFILVIIIPGLLLSGSFLGKNTSVFLRLFMSGVTGLVLFTFLFYITSLFRIRPLMFIYILISFVLFIRSKTLFVILNEVKDLLRMQALNKVRPACRQGRDSSLIAQNDRVSWFNLILIVIILAGTIFQVTPTFKSGLTFGYGVGFWGPNTHDGVWHMALVSELTKSVLPENPIYSGTILKNYHFFYDLGVVGTNYFSKIPVSDLVFRFYPIIFSLMLGLGSYFLVMRLFESSIGLFKAKVAAFFSLYLIYFAGSFGWIVEFLRERHFGGESAFWANQAVSFNLNGPFAISLIIVITILHMLFYSPLKVMGKIIAIVLLGTLISFKSYTGILLLGSLFLIAFVKVFRKRDFSYLWIVILSSLLASWLFISNFEIGSSLLVLAPFWLIHSMVDSPDRVGWVRLSLARTSSQTLGQWPKFLLTEAVSLTLFIVGNLGIRLLSFGLLFKIKEVFKEDTLLFIFVISIMSVGIPILFIQSGNPWNTIQFFYPTLYISALFAGVVISYLVFRLNKIFAIILISAVSILAPINSIVTASGYLGNKPHAFVSFKELEGLQFLSSQPDGVVLTYPYNDKLKRNLNEPWPLFVYDSTAYVSALSNKPVYIEDEPQNQILLTDYKKRLVASKDFFLKPISESIKFLQEAQIEYIYLPKIYSVRLDESSGTTKNIFENEEVIIYSVQN